MAVGTYLRVSTDEQRERQSIRTQRDEVLRYCARQGLEIFAEFADDGISGTVPFNDRPAGRRLLEAARQGKIAEVVAYKLDRIGRSTLNTLATVEELGKLDIGVRSATEAFESSTSAGRLMLTMLAGFAAHERECIRERSVAGTNRLAEAGTWLGGIVPYGYRQVGEDAKARLEVYEPEAKIIRTIFVAKIWRPGHVRNLLVNPTYRGEHHYSKRSSSRNLKVSVRAMPAIVPAELWEAAQATLKKNRLMVKRPDHVPYLLRGLIKCGTCGLAYVGSRTRSGFSHIYTCSGRQQYRAIHGPQWQALPSRALNGTAVDALVWADVVHFLRNPGQVLEKLRAKLTLGDTERQHREKHLASLKARLEDKDNERERVLRCTVGAGSTTPRSTSSSNRWTARRRGSSPKFGFACQSCQFPAEPSRFRPPSSFWPRSGSGWKAPFHQISSAASSRSWWPASSPTRWRELGSKKASW